MTRLRCAIAVGAALLLAGCGSGPARITPAEAAAMAEKAETLRKAGDLNAALGLFLKAGDAGNRGAALQAAALLEALGRWDEALLEYQKVLQDDPTNKVAGDHIVRILSGYAPIREPAPLNDSPKPAPGLPPKV